MGYTHYWRMTEPLKISKTQKELIKEVLEENKGILAQEYDKPNKPPVFNSKLLRFNGKGDEGHETLYIEFGKKEDFAFCKTAYKPYDEAVMKVLLILELSEGFTFSSDGAIDEEWKESLVWFTEKGFGSVLKNKTLPRFQAE